jgi:hypothetical protein
MQLVLFLLFFIGCKEDYSAFNNWKNGNVRELNLSQKTSTLKNLENECDYVGVIKGNSKSGNIHFHKNEKCNGIHHPVKSKYTVTPNSLQVCTDYRDGDHTCEKFNMEGH